MYEKMLYGRQVLYFRYAPPITSLDQATNDRPNPPYRGAPREQSSVYYYWWAFLRENEGYMASCAEGGKGEFAKLYRDFGDVRGDDFFAWWRSGGRDLFCEPPLEAPRVHLIPPNAVNGEREVLVTIPITGDLERTVAEVHALLKQAMADYRKRAIEAGKDIETSRARYPVHTKPVLTSLHQTLLVWQAKKQLGDGATFAQIGRKAGQMAAALKGEKGDDGDALSTTTAHRCVNAAKNLIANVGQGRFPDFSNPATGEVEEVETEAERRKRDAKERFSRRLRGK